MDDASFESFLTYEWIDRCVVSSGMEFTRLVDLSNGRRLAVHHYVNDRPVLLLLHANGFPAAAYHQLVNDSFIIAASPTRDV